MNNIININNYPNCCQMMSTDFHVKDVNNGSCEIGNQNNYDVSINHSIEDIAFLKIDKCVFNDGDDKKCDFALAIEKRICFVEIKSIEVFEKHQKRNKARKEAKMQLINTINTFKTIHKEINLLKTEAIISLVPKFEENYTKIISIKDQTVIDEFIEKCGCPNVYEGNVINF
jgi:hypothetical protein